jgi:hypothetical protein
VFRCVPVCLQSPYGGAINGQEEGGFVRVRNCRFWNNSGSDKGAAIHVETRTHLLDVADSVFDTNMVSCMLLCAAPASCTRVVLAKQC